MTDEHEDKMDYDFGESAALPGLELLTESELNLNLYSFSGYHRSAAPKTITMLSNISSDTETCQEYIFAARSCTPRRPFANGSRRKQPMASNLHGIGLMFGYNGRRINLSLIQHQKGGK
ncbi:MAG: hypothetical protein ACW987_19030 [Candidatus Thorarchaeota archaeon]